MKIDKLYMNNGALEFTGLEDVTSVIGVRPGELLGCIHATENGTVTIGCEIIGENIKYWVHNPGFVPRDIQLQIFNRSFSTKNQNRGLGTYSMKLLSSFLKGTVNFTTSEEDGTIFNAEYPIKLEDELINN